MIESTQIFCVWNPTIPIKLISIRIDTNLLEWCWNVANGSEMHCIGSNQCEMGWNMEFGLEFGSAGPIWMRLLFIWPKPYENSSDLFWMKPQGFNQPEMALKCLKLVILVSHCSESFRNSMDRFCLSKMDRNMEIGLEFGSAGPIWVRLLFVSPDPILMVMLQPQKAFPHFNLLECASYT